MVGSIMGKIALAEKDIDIFFVDFNRKFIEEVKRVIEDAKLSLNDVNKIILIGGQTRMPLVRKFVEDTLGKGDIYVTATGNKDVIRIEHMKRMKDQAIVCNIGHFDNEIQVSALKKYRGIKRENIKPRVDKFIFPDGKAIYLLAEGRLVNLAAAEGHPSEVMATSFAGQSLACEYLVKNRGKLPPKVLTLPEELDDQIAALQLEAMGVKVKRLF
jgi:adenosylhomocysteinase